MSAEQAKHDDGQALLAEMDKTIPLKIGFCAAHMMLPPGSTVLDAGCANGETTAYFALQYPEVSIMGVDYDGEYITRAKTKFGGIENATFLQADLLDFDLNGLQLDATLNLSVLHEFQSFTGFRTQSVTEILANQLRNTRDYGLVINRDFNQPDRPDEMVYIALPGDDGLDNGDDFAALSTAAFFLRYSQEAMRTGADEDDQHIKGFFTEEHTDRLSDDGLDIPNGWRVFSVQHKFAWEFIWRQKYRERFLDEARERYAFWTQDQHREEPQKIGARVLYSAPYENPWLHENWYEPNSKLLDKDLKPLPLPPSNFISVYQKIPEGESVELREHRAAQTPPSYLKIQGYRNTQN